MRLAALYDIHANCAALEAVLREARLAGADALLIGGDVLPGPQPRATLDCLRATGLPLHCLHGNGDREVLATRRGMPNQKLPKIVQREIAWCAAQISDEDAAWLATWPATLTLSVGAQEAFFCHATARNDVEIFTVRTPPDSVARAFASVHSPTIVCGHTHMPFDRQVGNWRILNAGSVGIPFGDPRPAWLLIDDSFNLRRTPYALDRNRLAALDCPQGPGSGLAWIFHPPSAAEMLDLFARSSLS